MLQDWTNFDVEKSALSLTFLLRLFILVAYSSSIKLSSCWLAEPVSMTYPGWFVINHHGMAWLTCLAPAPKVEFRIPARVWRAPMIVAQVAEKVCSRSRRHLQSTKGRPDEVSGSWRWVVALGSSFSSVRGTWLGASIVQVPSDAALLANLEASPKLTLVVSVLVWFFFQPLSCLPFWLLHPYAFLPNPWHFDSMWHLVGMFQPCQS